MNEYNKSPKCSICQERDGFKTDDSSLVIINDKIVLKHITVHICSQCFGFKLPTGKVHNAVLSKLRKLFPAGTEYRFTCCFADPWSGQL